MTMISAVALSPLHTMYRQPVLRHLISFDSIVCPDLFTLHSLLLDLNEQLVQKLMDHLEQYVMGRLYAGVFCPASSDDEQQDLSLHKR